MPGDLTADFARIESLVSAEPGCDLPWLDRDSAYHLRWLEISAAGG